jgi:hypothetical protein
MLKVLLASLNWIFVHCQKHSVQNNTTGYKNVKEIIGTNLVHDLKKKVFECPLWNHLLDVFRIFVLTFFKRFALAIRKI